VSTIKADPEDEMPITVIKKVWDGSHWADEATVDYGDTVTFNITVIYYKNTEDGLLADQIVVNDTLPENYLYAGNANFEPSYVSDNFINWNLSEDYDLVLEDNQSVSIEFDATALDYGEKINTAEATAFELCCDWTLYGTDTATVIVGDPLVLMKEVYDSETGEWAENLTSYVKKSEALKFRLTVTYNGYSDVELMKCMYVEDYLPECCLEYLGNDVFIYPDDNLFDDPEINVSSDNKTVKYDWTSRKFNLYAGQSIVIEFEASVVEYCYDTVLNCAYAEIYNCLGCPNPLILTDEVCSEIYCYPPDTAIEKTVLDPDTQEWVEEVEVVVGETVTFKIDLSYYGNYNLSNISILDELHPSTEFTGTASPMPEIDGDLLWWNFTEPLNDSETISIEFEAEAIAGTGSTPGFNQVSVEAFENSVLFEDSDTAGVIVKTNSPPCPPDVRGDEHGEEGEVLTYYAITGDMDGDQIYYMFDWGDGTFSEWLGPYDSLAEVQATNSWSTAATYNVRVKAKDDPMGYESLWSHYPVVVTIVEPPVLSLNVTINRGLGMSIGVRIENDGEAELNNIQWTLEVDRRGLFQKELFNDSGTITSLDVDETEILSAMPSGIGLMSVKVTVEAPGLPTIEESADGFIFLMLTYLPA
jgi:fimbrial isopeptide formation D2 family protein